MSNFLELASPAQMDQAFRVRTSEQFDMAFYLASVSDRSASLDPALHYVVVGEGAGLAASSRFRAEDYRTLNPDLAGLDLNMLYHLEAYGRAGGRPYALVDDAVRMDTSRIDDGKATLILLLASAEGEEARLGCALVDELRLTRNVVVVLQQGGPAEQRLADAAAALIGPLPRHVASDPREARSFAARLNWRYAPRYALANGVRCRRLAIGLRQVGTPVVALVHQFLDRRRPHRLHSLYELSDAVVFPAEAVRRDSVQAYGLLQQRLTYITPCGLIAHEGSERTAPRLPTAPFEVVGFGLPDLQGGLDIFIRIVEAFSHAHPGLEAKFTWLLPADVGLVSDVEALVKRQSGCNGLPDRLVFGCIGDTDLLDARMDALVLCSRAYTIPAIEAEAAARGVPLLCLRGSAFADLLRADPLSSWLVAPSGDVASLADVIAELIVEPHRRDRAASAMRRLARRSFDTSAYARSLDEVGSACARRAEAVSLQADDLVLAAVPLDGYFRGAAEPPLGEAAAARRYLDDMRSVDFTGPAVDEHHPRRALAGFHPFIYARLAADYEAGRDGDPLVHFTRRGRPPGPWKHDVIRLDAGRPSAPSAPAPPLRAAIHGHFHYTDNIGEFLRALEASAARVDLFLTTTGEAAADRLRRAVEPYASGAASVEVTPNAGRDIGPFIQLLGSGLQPYDVVGHVHGKRSIHTLDYDAEFGNRWRDFLWRQLIGPSTPVVDIVLAEFGRDPGLGLVFPENEQFIGWEKNRASAAALALRLKLESLPEHMEFPAGTMFWARPQALTALLRASFRPEDYPQEPLPDDGTMLHALERMLPIIVQHAGFHYATTYDPEVTRLAGAGA